MSETKHTPGQWSINGNKIDGNGYHLASINSHSTIEGKANARLIAAAPDLLEFAKAVVRYAGNAGDDYLADKARAIIAKATT